MRITPLCRTILFYGILLLGLTALMWGRSLDFGFAWDDYILIVENPSMGAASGFAQSFSRSFWDIGEQISDTTRDFYRPLVSLSYRLDYAQWQLKPFGYHLTNVLLHLCNVLLIFLLAVQITKRPTVAFCAALIWAIHPARVENVCWISGRTDLICGVFFFAAYLTFLRWQQRENHSMGLMVSVLVCFLMALLGKEMAITLPALIIAHAGTLGCGKRTLREHIGLLSSLCVVTFVYIGGRIVILGDAVGTTAFGTNVHRLVSIPMLIVKYMGVMTCLVPVDPHHSEGFVTSPWNGWFVVPVLFGFLYTWMLIKLWRARRKMIVFLLCWFPVTILPVLYAGSFGDVLYADRFLYIPSVGVSLAAVLAVDQALAGAGVGRQASCLIKRMIFLVCCMSLGGYSYIVSNHWRNGLSLFIRASKTSPESAYIHYNLANSFARLGFYEQASGSYADAIALNPDDTSALVNRAAALNKLGRFEEALDCLARAAIAGGARETLLGNCGIAYLGLENVEEAMRFFEMAQGVRETHWVYLNMAKCVLAVDPTDTEGQATRWLYRSIDMLPTAEAYYQLALINSERGAQSTARRSLARARSLLRSEHDANGLSRQLDALERALAEDGIHE